MQCGQGCQVAIANAYNARGQLLHASVVKNAHTALAWLKHQLGSSQTDTTAQEQPSNAQAT